MPVRKGDPARLLAAVNAQRAALGRPEWPGPVTVGALEAACVASVLDAIDLDQGPERDAARLAVVYLLGLLEQKAPGRAVEVRIPPFAAIQCVEGPRHTRGTPPNVVETDAVTWVLLATGRLSWADAVADAGRVRASGPRSDISGLLPLTAFAS
jgi:Bacterial SCP ortholog